ncbi:MAG TPA: hypothetical protein VK009_29910 [Chloroflexota bacterium]|nr:hypothetical protein [Chloroflexota bacterium]
MPPRPAPPRRRTPPPRKQIVWKRAAPIFIGMMALLFLSQLYLSPMFPGNPIFGSPSTSGGFGGIGFSLVAGLLGAFLISRYATTMPPPPPSKTQQRKQAAAASRSKKEAAEEDEEGDEVAAAPARAPAARRRRRRR